MPELSPLPHGKRTGKAQCVETPCSAPHQKKGHHSGHQQTHTLPQSLSTSFFLSFIFSLSLTLSFSLSLSFSPSLLLSSSPSLLSHSPTHKRHTRSTQHKSLRHVETAPTVQLWLLHGTSGVFAALLLPGAFPYFLPVVSSHLSSSWTMYRGGYSQKRDVLFMRLLEGLLAELRNALVDVGLGDPCTLVVYPRMTAEEIYKRGVALQESHEHVKGIVTTGGIAATPFCIDGTGCATIPPWFSQCPCVCICRNGRVDWCVDTVEW